MRKILISSAVLACLASVFVNAYGQNTGTGGTKKTVAPASASAQPADPPHRIALIDLGRVFKEYKKIETLKEDWKSEFSVSEDSAKQMAAKIQSTVEKLKQFKAGSDQYINLEKQQTQLTADFDAFRKNSQRELLRKEADLLKTVYLETMEVVEKFADKFGYTLVMRIHSCIPRVKHS